MTASLGRRSTKRRPWRRPAARKRRGTPVHLPCFRTTCSTASPRRLRPWAARGSAWGTDNLTNVARARESIPQIESEMQQYLAGAGHTKDDSEYKALEQTLKDQQDVGNLTAGERVFGVSSGLLQMGAAGLEAGGKYHEGQQPAQEGRRRRSGHPQLLHHEQYCGLRNRIVQGDRLRLRGYRYGGPHRPAGHPGLRHRQRRDEGHRRRHPAGFRPQHEEEDG